MKSIECIKEKIESISKDERLSYPPTNILINAPLALIQLSFETKIQTLKWVLSEIEDI